MLKPIICIGGALIDELFHAHDEMLLSTTNMMTAKKSPGGVARNIAHQLAFLQVPVQLICVFGNDVESSWMKDVCTSIGVKLDASITTKAMAGKYTGIINKDGSLFTALLSNSLDYLITPEYLQKQQSLLQTASYILAETNLTAQAIQWIIHFCNQYNIPLIIETVSVPPAKKLVNLDLNNVYMITPNEDELFAVCNNNHSTESECINELFERGVQNIWLHKGAQGSVLFNKNETVVLHSHKINVEDCTGAGDSSLAGWIFGKHLQKNDLDCLKIAHTLAIETLQVDGAMATHLNPQQLLQLASKYYEE
jgi:pseudouridine kinase